MRRSLSVWVPFLAFVWWVLEPTPGAWVAGLLAVVVALVLRQQTGPARATGLRPLAFLAFLPYFLAQSVLGGWDVARRALAPRLPLDPDLLRYRLSLPPGPSRVFLGNALSLLPGTFAADLEGDELTVHLLVAGPDAEARIRTLELRVGALFGAEAP